MVELSDVGKELLAPQRDLSASIDSDLIAHDELEAERHRRQAAIRVQAEAERRTEAGAGAETQAASTADMFDDDTGRRSMDWTFGLSDTGAALLSHWQLRQQADGAVPPLTDGGGASLASASASTAEDVLRTEELRAGEALQAARSHAAALERVRRPSAMPSPCVPSLAAKTWGVALASRGVHAARVVGRQASR